MKNNILKIILCIVLFGGGLYLSFNDNLFLRLGGFLLVTFAAFTVLKITEKKEK